MLSTGFRQRPADPEAAEQSRKRLQAVRSRTHASVSEEPATWETEACPTRSRPAASRRMIAILIDGDGCSMKDETYVVATRYGIPVALVANSPLYVPEGMGVQRIVVDQGPDAADDWIAEHAQPGDVVVTADLPLAARCLAAGARVLGTNGRELDEESIGGLLATRELKENLRGAGVMTGGPSPLSDRDRARFSSKLDELVQRSLREFPS